MQAFKYTNPFMVKPYFNLYLIIYYKYRDQIKIYL